MSNQHSVSKRHRRPKSEKRVDYSTRTMAAIKEHEEAAKKLAGKTSPTLPLPTNA